MTDRFVGLTEIAGTPVSREGADMIRTRYEYATSLAGGKRVLELACGSGIGLGLLDGVAEQVVAGDIEWPLVEQGKGHYGDRIPFLQLDVQALPFRDAAFDLVLLFEALYYVPDAERAFDEAVRVLAPGGRVVFVNANPERPDFIKSPHSFHYHTAGELRTALADRGLEPEIAGAFPVSEGGLVSRIAPLARRVLEGLGLVPRSLKGRAALKRLISGPLVTLPAEIDETFGTPHGRAPVPPGDPAGFKVIYGTGVKPG